MKKKGVGIGIRLITFFTFFAMVMVNGLANYLEINGVKTGEVSLIYSNLFAPAAITFAIWGVIYLLLLAYVIYFLSSVRTVDTTFKNNFHFDVAFIFCISSIANIGWVFSWHYDLIIMSMVCISILYVCLCLIDFRIKKEELNTKELLYIRIPFSLYFGWLTLAIIANATVLMVKFSLEGFNGSEEFWTMIMICLSAILAVVIIVSGKDPIYGLAILWGFIGILIKHVSRSGFSYQYPDIVMELIVCIGILIIIISYYFCSGKSYSKRMDEELYEEINNLMEEEPLEDIEIEEDIEEKENMKHWIKNK